jgi:WD domain, G-beta repeat.
VRCVAYYHSGIFLASGSEDKIIKIFNLSKNIKEFSLLGHSYKDKLENLSLFLLKNKKFYKTLN